MAGRTPVASPRNAPNPGSPNTDQLRVIQKFHCNTNGIQKLDSPFDMPNQSKPPPMPTELLMLPTKPLSMMTSVARTPGPTPALAPAFGGLRPNTTCGSTSTRYSG